MRSNTRVGNTWPDLLLLIASTAVAFAAAGWLRFGASKPLLTSAWTAGHLLAALCVALLAGAPWEKGRHRIIVGCLAFLLVLVGAIMWPWRGVIWVTANPAMGLALSACGLTLALLAAVRAGRPSPGYVTLAVLSLMVALGIAALALRPSPERSARAFARLVSAGDLPNASKLLTPSCRQRLSRLGASFSHEAKILLSHPRGSLLRGTRSSGMDTQTVVLFEPRSAWGHGSSFGRFSALTLEKQSDGTWLIATSSSLRAFQRPTGTGGDLR